MRTFTLGLLAASAIVVTGCTDTGYGARSAGYSSYRSYDWNRPDPSYGSYDAGRYYREDNRRYRERRLSRNDRVYRGRDGRYYCRRSDGTTGLIVGAAAGGTLGAIIAPGGSEVLGALIGGAAGAVIGKSVDQGEVRCR